MNRIYRVIWNSSLGVWQAVSEIGKSAGKKKNQGRRQRAKLGLIAGSVFLVSAQAYAGALPTDGSVSLGSGNISQSDANTLNITQTTQKMAIDWQSFSVGQDSTVNFIQPSASSIALNRVTGSDVSTIQGAINANGQVFLINPNGILFSSTAQVNVGGLIASTRDLTNENFSADNFVFEGNNGSAVINQGSLVATDGGYVVMIAAKVQNMGDIVANQGSVQLAAGDSVLVNMGGTVSVEVQQGAIDALIENGGAIRADGGHILLTAKAAGDLAASVVNNTGIVEATSLVSQGGEIVFMGDDITNSGTVVADGATGGGDILLGGDWQGGNAEQYAHATKVTLTQTSDISANATTQGDGGKVVVWSDIKNADSVTKVAGSISATGQGENTNGGQIETSGNVLNVATGTQVKAAEWLLDPTNITISSGNGGSLTSDATSSDVGADTIETALNAGTSVTVQTDAEVAGDGDITVAADITKSSGADATLTLTAANNIVINDGVSISASTGALNTVLRADNDSNSTGAVTMGAGSSITTNGGDVFIGGATDTNSAATVTTQAITAAAGNVKILSTGDISLGSITSTGAVELSSTGTVTQTGAITGEQNVNLQGTGGAYTLTNASNAIGTLTADTGSVELVNSSAQTTAKITTTDALSLTSGSLTINDDISAGAGNITFNTDALTVANDKTISGSGEAKVAAKTATTTIGVSGGSGSFQVSMADFADGFSGITIGGESQSGNIEVGAVALSDALTLQTTGNITQNGAITGNQDLTLVGGGAHNLNNASNAIGTLTATSSTLTFHGTSYGLGDITTTGAVELSSTGTVTQTGAITGGQDLTLQGSGTYTLTNASNAIGTLTANTGSLSVTNNQDFSLGSIVTTGAVELSSTGAVTQTGAITGDQALNLLGTGSYTLNNTGNDIASLAANTGSLSVTNNQDFSLGSIVTTGAVELSSTGAVTQTGAITGGQNVNLLGTGGVYTLDNTSNAIGTLTAYTGSLNVTNNSDFALGAITTTGAVTLSSTGAVTQTSTITSGQDLNLLGAGGAYTLTNNNNVIGTLTANTGSVELVNNRVTRSRSPNTLTTGAITTTGALNLTSDALTINDNIAAGAGDIKFNTDALTVASDKTVSGSGTLQVTTKTADTTMGINGGTGTLQVSTADFSNEFANVTLGSADHAGGIEIGADTTLNDAITLQTGGTLAVNNNLVAGSNDLTLKVGKLTIAADKTISGTGILTVASKTDSEAINIGGSSQQLNAADFGSKIENGFSDIVIGGAEQTGDINIVADSTLAASVTLQTSGTLSVNNDLAAGNDGAETPVGYDLTLKVGGFTVAADKAISGTGVLTVASNADSETIGIGGATGNLQLTADNLNTDFADTFSEVVIGGSSQSGDITTAAIELGRAVTLQTTGDVTQTGAITGGQDLNLLGTGGTHTLTNAGNAIGNLTANTGSVALVNSSAQTTGAITTTDALSLMSDALTINDNIAAGAGNITFNTDALTVASDKTVSGSGTLQVTTKTAGTTMGINGGTGTLQFSTADFADGFSGVTIGSAVHTGGIEVGADTTLNDSTTLQTSGTLAVNNNLVAGSNDLTLKVGTLTIADAQTISGSGVLTVAADTDSKTIGLGGANGDLQLTSDNFSTDFADGFSGIVIGDSGQSGNIKIGAVALSDALTLQTSGTVTQTGAITGEQDLNLLGVGGTHTLTNESNSIGTLTANTGSVDFVNSAALVVGNMTATTGLTVTSASDITVESGKTLTAPLINLYSSKITNQGTLDASSTMANGGNITLAKDASTAADFISLEGELNASTTSGTGGTIITNGQSVFLNTSADITTAGNTANGTWKTPVSTFDTVVAETGGDLTGESIAEALKTANYELTASSVKVNLSEKLATQNTLQDLTDAEITIADFGGITINDSITKESAGTSGTAPSPVYDITTDTTLTVESTSNITVNGAISSEKQRLNVVLTANSDKTDGGNVMFGSNGSVSTNNGNFYVGSVALGTATNGVSYAYNVSAYQDEVTASAENFTMNTGSQVNVGTGSLIVKVTKDINLPTGDATDKSYSLNSSASSSGYNNETETNRYRSGTYNSERIANVPVSVTLEAGGSITGASTDSTKINTTSSAVVNITSHGEIGVEDSPILFASNSGTLNLTNTLGSTYLRFVNSYSGLNFSNLNLTTDTTTAKTTQSIDFNSDGSHRLLATTDASGVFSIATGGFVDETTSKYITIKAPNITLESGAIVATGGFTYANYSDIALLDGTGLNLTLTALSGSTYGEIKADNAAVDYSSTTAPSDFSNKEVYLPNGTLTLNSSNTGVKTSGDDVWSNALEVTANTLNVNNSGGSTWLRNSDYNSVNFSAVDSNGDAAGHHHILSTNGDFFNIETTASNETIIHTIDTENSLSGIKTDNRNVSLKTGATINESRNIIMADNAIDIGAATLSLTSYYGKQILAYSVDHAQDVGSTITATRLSNESTPTVTVGNLNLTTANNTTDTASIGGDGYTLKVAKGGEAGEANVGENVLTINNESGDIDLHELSAEHFKTIKVSYSSTDSTARAHTVEIDLFDNNSVTENLNYLDTGNGLITLEDLDNSVVLSGFNRNFDLYAYNKDIQVNNIYGGSGYFNVTSYSNSITLNGDVNTNGGNISLVSNTFKLAGSSRIDSNADDKTNTTSVGAAGRISLNNSSGSRGVDISANTGVTAALTLDSSSSDGSGGSITTDMNATNTAGSYLTDLSFIGSGVTTDQDGSISLTGASYALNGDFTATGKVALNGGESTSSTYNIPDVLIDTNQSVTDSGDITFSGYSLSGKSSRNYSFNTSSTGGNGGDVNLYPASTTGTFGAGSMAVNTVGSTSGTITLPAVTTTKNSSFSYTTSSTQSYTGSTITLNGNLQSNQADIDILGSEVVLANDVSIDTYTGFVSGQASTASDVSAGSVTVGSTEAKLTNNDPAYSFAIDTSGNKGAETYAANNGAITLRDSTTTTFNNFSIVGGGNLNTGFDTTKYSATGQVTIGQLDGGSFTWNNLNAGSLLLKGPANYTITGNIGAGTSDDFVAGTLAATGVANLDITTDNALTIGSLSSVSGVSATGTVSIATKADDLTVNNNITTTSTADNAITLNADSTTDAGTATGGNVLLNSALSTGSGGRATVYTGSIEDSGSYNFGDGHYRYNSDETNPNDTTALGAGNYAVYREQPTLTIGFSFEKEYDGVELIPSSNLASFTGIVNGDASQFTNDLSWKNEVSDQKIINAGEYAIERTGTYTGATELGYEVVDAPSLTYTINRKALTVSLADQTKIYDGDTSAVLEANDFNLAGFVTVEDKVEGASVTQTVGTYNDKNVIGATTVNAVLTDKLSANEGTLLSNYIVPTDVTGNGSITARTLTASIVDTPTKVYDGNTDATLTNDNFSLANLVTDESFTVSKKTGTYNDKDVLEANSVTTSLVADDFAEGSNTLASNYIMPVTATGAGSISARTLTASIVETPTKVYDGNTDATLTNNNFSIANLVDGESFTVSKEAGTYDDKDVADVSSVTTSLVAGDFAVVGSTLASNYTMPVTATGAGSITARTLTASIINSPTKVYDGNTDATLTNDNFSLSNLVKGENFTVNKTTGTYNDKDVADANRVTTDLSADDFDVIETTLKTNYTLPTAATGEAEIEVRSLVAVAETQDKIFDAKTDTKTVLSVAKEDANLREPNTKGNPLVVNGIVGNEQAFITFTEANFSDVAVGIDKTVTINGLAVAGADAANYVVMVKDAFGNLTVPADSMTTTADINPNNIPAVTIPTPPPMPVVIPQPNLGNAPVVAVGGMRVVAIQSTGTEVATSVGSDAQGVAPVEAVLLAQANSGVDFANQVFIVDGGVNTDNSVSTVNPVETDTTLDLGISEDFVDQASTEN